MGTADIRKEIHDYIDHADDRFLRLVYVINQFYETLCKEEILRTKLIRRAEKSENDIRSGNVLSRSEIEQRTNDLQR